MAKNAFDHVSREEVIELHTIIERLDQTAALARLFSYQLQTTDECDAVRGIAETVDELASRLDSILNPRVQQ